MLLSCESTNIYLKLVLLLSLWLLLQTERHYRNLTRMRKESNNSVVMDKSTFSHGEMKQSEWCWSLTVGILHVHRDDSRSFSLSSLKPPKSKMAGFYTYFFLLNVCHCVPFFILKKIKIKENFVRYPFVFFIVVVMILF